MAFRARTDGRIHYALVAGTVEPAEPTLIRVHVHDSLYDLTASRRRDAGWPIGDALRRVTEEGSGIVVVLRPPEPPNEIIARIDSYHREDEGEALPQHDPGTDLRTVGLGAQILADLGVRRMRVLSAPKRLHAISGFGLEVVEYVGEHDTSPEGDGHLRSREPATPAQTRAGACRHGAMNAFAGIGTRGTWHVAGPSCPAGPRPAGASPELAPRCAQRTGSATSSREGSR